MTKNFFYYLLIVSVLISLSGCKKERVYFSEGEIEYTLEGNFKGYSVDEKNELSLFFSYEQSQYSIRDDFTDIEISRYSEDLQSVISIFLRLDEDYNYNSGNLQFDLMIHEGDSKILNIESRFLSPYDLSHDADPGLLGPSYSITNIEFNPSSKEISGDIYFNSNDQDDDGYVIEGSFDVKLYEHIR